MKQILICFFITLSMSIDAFPQGYASIEELLMAQCHEEFKEYFEAERFSKEDMNSALKLGTLVRQPQKLIASATQLSNKGYAIGDYWLGWCYEGGEGIEMNYDKAFYYFQKAANHRNPFPYALEKLGSYYYSGTGVPQNYNEAYKWFNKGNQVIRHKDYRAVCLYRMAYIFLNKDSVSKSDMDSAFNLFCQVANLSNKQSGSDFNHKAYGSLVPYMHKHAAYLAAMLILTEGAHGGNETEGISWLEKSAVLGDDEGQFALGIYLLSKHEKDPKGIEWIKKSAAQGNSDALIFLNESK
ncbi:sel1 repeat family protein [Muribaculaceae bacterium Isolate-104 (HZI)]|jgi:hypothetical protein|nr:sel1 repeat family protein [Muribaculaceae bacterium Isolate-104 (HZI)]